MSQAVLEGRCCADDGEDNDDDGGEDNDDGDDNVDDDDDDVSSSESQMQLLLQISEMLNCLLLRIVDDRLNLSLCIFFNVIVLLKHLQSKQKISGL